MGTLYYIVKTLAGFTALFFVISLFRPQAQFWFNHEPGRQNRKSAFIYLLIPCLALSLLADAMEPVPAQNAPISDKRMIFIADSVVKANAKNLK